jgi:hypothetical protein
MLDARGYGKENLRIELSRDGINKTYFNNDANLLISLPPGLYSVDVFNEDRLICSRKLNVLGDRSFDLITSEEPIFPYFFTLIIVITTLIFSTYLYIKNIKKYYLKILPIMLSSISIFLPWWILNGKTGLIETSTKMFLIPLKLITITSTDQVIGGELAFLPELFLFVNSMIPLITIVGILLIVCSIIFEKYYVNLNLIFLFSSIVFLILSLIIFTYSMSQLTEVGIGSFIGQGLIDVKIPGEEIESSILCNWGPSIGYLLYLISIIALSLNIIFYKKKCKN